MEPTQVRKLTVFHLNKNNIKVYSTLSSWQKREYHGLRSSQEKAAHLKAIRSETLGMLVAILLGKYVLPLLYGFNLNGIIAYLDHEAEIKNLRKDLI
ncbi:32731_t:CDS:2 [Racocetra persica]|uniref:32731_t:CDS:1 n=1 Tax=Racocetra persica TaxID=160502 RepID=A0ACA9MLS0_9GLOM|nr:32731_t:CDS:2 [Racocetra persica]